jgi:hypothetical protein
MRLRIFALSSIVVLGFSSSPAQRSTERFIPLGQSPGLSGKYTSMGTIKEINATTRVLSCTYQGGAFSLKVTEKTKIWVDRSKLKLSNQKGSFPECATGRMIEVKYVNNDRRDGGEAEWIKVQAADAR